MQEKILANKASPGYLISTVKLFFTVMDWGEGHVLIEHFKWQELLLKDSRRKFLGGSILGLPGSHYWRILVFLEKYFSVMVTEPSGLSSVQSIHCFTITDIAEGCASGSAKKQFFQYKHPFCRQLKQKKNAVHWHVAKQRKGHMSRTIYIFCITILPFLTPSSHKLLRFLCTHNIERKWHRS